MPPPGRPSNRAATRPCGSLITTRQPAARACPSQRRERVRGDHGEGVAARRRWPGPGAASRRSSSAPSTSESRGDHRTATRSTGPRSRAITALVAATSSTISWASRANCNASGGRRSRIQARRNVDRVVVGHRPTTRVTTLQTWLRPTSGQAAYDAEASTTTVRMPRPSSTTANGRFCRRLTQRQMPKAAAPRTTSTGSARWPLGRRRHRGGRAGRRTHAPPAADADRVDQPREPDHPRGGGRAHCRRLRRRRPGRHRPSPVVRGEVARGHCARSGDPVLRVEAEAQHRAVEPEVLHGRDRCDHGPAIRGECRHRIDLVVLWDGEVPELAAPASQVQKLDVAAIATVGHQEGAVWGQRGWRFGVDARCWLLVGDHAVDDRLGALPVEHVQLEPSS